MVDKFGGGDFKAAKHSGCNMDVTGCCQFYIKNQEQEGTEQKILGDLQPGQAKIEEKSVQDRKVRQRNQLLRSLAQVKGSLVLMSKAMEERL